MAGESDPDGEKPTTWTIYRSSGDLTRRSIEEHSARRYVSGDEDKLSSIEEGKLADLVVLGGDYLAGPGEQISDLPVLTTVVGGKVMYERNP